METDHGTLLNAGKAAQFINRADFKYLQSLKCGQSTVRVNTYSTGFFKREGIENYI